MTRRTYTFLALICATLASSGAAVKADFTIRCQVDFSGAAADEPLYEAGPVRLAFRMAGRTKELEQYDSRCGNYLNFPMSDGSCPVIEATMNGLRVGIPPRSRGRNRDRGDDERPSRGNPARFPETARRCP